MMPNEERGKSCPILLSGAIAAKGIRADCIRDRCEWWSTWSIHVGLDGPVRMNGCAIYKIAEKKEGGTRP